MVAIQRALGTTNHDDLVDAVGQLLEDRRKLELVREDADDLQARLDDRSEAVGKLQRNCESARDRLASAIESSATSHDVHTATKIA